MLKKNLPKFKAVLFDLDGTLIDTAPDLAGALNYVLNIENKNSLPLSVIRGAASDGALGLLKLGFNIDEHHPRYLFLRQQLLDYYREHIHQKTCLFAGIESILMSCEQKNIPWGIVTNKPGYLTDVLLKKLRLDRRAACVVSGDTLRERKPHPAPLIYAAGLLGFSSDECCYIGDALRDITAAKAANMFVIGALYGYIAADIDPFSWQADAYVYSPDQLSDLIF